MFKGIRPFVIILTALSLLSVSISSAGWRDYIANKNLAVAFGGITATAIYCACRASNLSKEVYAMQKSFLLGQAFWDPMIHNLFMERLTERRSKKRLHFRGYMILSNVVLFTAIGAWMAHQGLLEFR